jgi:hypothetical protein
MYKILTHATILFNLLDEKKLHRLSLFMKKSAIHAYFATDVKTS